MRRNSHAWAVIATLILLAGCSTDGLTPQADVPDSPKATNTVATDESPAPRQQVAQNDSEEQQPFIDSESGGQTGRAPQNTLEAQAQAIQNGEENPSETKVKREGNLGANLYRTDSETTQVASLYSAQTAKSSIRFLPIIGAPVQAVTPLSKELGSAARGSGLTIKGSSDETAEHVLKGYLSAFRDGDKVTVVYVWDVLDNAGTRLHRIQGQQSVPANGSETWPSVPNELMQEIGTATIAEYVKWKGAQG